MQPRLISNTIKLSIKLSNKKAYVSDSSLYLYLKQHFERLVHARVQVQKVRHTTKVINTPMFLLFPFGVGTFKPRQAKSTRAKRLLRVSIQKILALKLS
jgi:hypothetical protein